MAYLEDEMPRFAANLHCLLGHKLFDDAFSYVQQQFHFPSDAASGAAVAGSAASAAAATDEPMSAATRRAGQFYEALCLLLSGHIELATGRLNRLLDDADYSLPASVCILHIHRDLQCTSSASASTIRACHERVALHTKSASAMGLFYAAIATMYCGGTDNESHALLALEYVKQHLAAAQGGSNTGRSTVGKWLKATVLLSAAGSDNVAMVTTNDENDGILSAGDSEEQSSHNANESADEAARLFQEIISKQQSKPDDPNDAKIPPNGRNRISKHLLSAIGLCECYARRNDSKRLGDTISRIAHDLNASDADDSSSLLALRLLKVRSFLLNHDWESAVEVATDISSDNDAVNDNITTKSRRSTAATEQQLPRNTDNILGELIVALSHLCHYAREDDFRSSIDRLFALVRTREPRNIRLRVWLVRLLSRLVCTPEFVRKTRNFLGELLLGNDVVSSSASELSSQLRQTTASIDQLFELAHQYRLHRETDSAIEVVKEIMRRLQVVGSVGHSSPVDSDGIEEDESDDEIANIRTMMTYTEILLDAAEYAGPQAENKPQATSSSKSATQGKRTGHDTMQPGRRRAAADVPSSSGDSGSGDPNNHNKTPDFYFEQAEQQYDFLEQLMLSVNHDKASAALANSPRYIFLKARMTLKRIATAVLNEDDVDSASSDHQQHSNTSFVHALSLLNKAAHKHVNMLQNMAFGVEFLYALDAEFITAMIRTMLRVVVGTGMQCQSLGVRTTSQKLDERGRSNNNNYASAIVQQAENLLEQIYKALPTPTASSKISDNDGDARSATTSSSAASLLLPDLQFIMARVLYMRGGGGKQNQAINLLQRVIEQHPSHEEASLLLARISCNQLKFKHCLSTLETALAHNFALPQRVDYWVVTAQANIGLKNMAAARDNIAKAVRLLDTLPTWPHLTGIQQHQEAAVQDFQLILELLDVCTNCGDLLTARTLLEQVKAALVGQQAVGASSQQLNEMLTLAEARILMGNSQQADEVLKLLKGLDPESVFHEQARDLIGNVLLNMKHNEKGFIELYQTEFSRLTASKTTDLATRVQAHIMLSNAYMRLPAPERAIQALEAAVKMDSKNVQLITRLGLLYTRCHYFKKAVNYYELSVKRGNDELLPELVQLLVDMDNYDRARQVIDEFNERTFSSRMTAATGDESSDTGDVAPDSRKAAGQPSSKKISVELHVISAKLFVIKSSIFKRANEDWRSAKECLVKAKDEFLYAIRSVPTNAALKRASRERPDLEQTISKAFVNTSCELCEQYLLREHLFQDAKTVYLEALGVTTPGGASASSSDERVMLGLVRALIGLRDISQAQSFINTSFNGGTQNAHVRALSAEIYLHRQDIPQVVSVATGILATSPPARPPDAAVIVTVIDLLFRAGYLPTSMSTTMRALDGLAQKYSHYHAQLQEFETGLSFCRALLHRCAGNDDAAEQLFKPLLTVPRWATQAALQLTFCVLKWNVYMPGFDLTAMQSASSDEATERATTPSSARPKTRGGNPTITQSDESTAVPSGNMAVKLTNDEVIILRQMLLKTLPPDLLALSPTYAVYALLPLVYATDQKNVNEFYHAASAMRERWPKSVAPMWAVATCLRLFGRDREAHALLKTTLSLPWNMEEADMLERCWMMLIVESNLSDVAAATASSSISTPAAVVSPAINSILDKCLRYNQNCYFANLLLAQQIERDAANAGGILNKRLNASKASLSREKQHERKEFSAQLQMAVDRYEAAFRVSAGKDAFSGVKLVKAALETGHAERAMETLVVLMQNETVMDGSSDGGENTSPETNFMLYRDLMRNCADIFRT